MTCRLTLCLEGGNSMIYNERQNKITVSEIKNMKDALSKIPKVDDELTKWISEIQRNALSSQISDLEAEVREYALIKEGKLKYQECSDLSSLPKVLINARIASGWSQKELGAVLNMSAQQIQRYEATNYMGASLSRLIEISSILGVKVKESWGGERCSSADTIFIWDNISNISWDKFPIKEMLTRQWIQLKNKQSPVDCIREYFARAAGGDFATALHRKKFHGGNSPNEYSLLAWQARLLEKARDQYADGTINHFELNDTWMPELVALSLEDDAPVKVKGFLASKGIILVTERHLQGTYLDGAAMLLESGNPVIGLTLRYDRLDNFFYVLFHELGHVFQHLFQSLGLDFFDEEGSNVSDELEVEADKFALNSLISEENWDSCLSRYLLTEISVVNDANRLGVHPSIVAGRIRKERNNYLILNNLIGQGEVRKRLEEK